MKIIFDDGKEIEFDENEVALQDHRERIFKKDGIWYITKIINKDFAKWLDETKPMIIKEKKIPEKLECYHQYDECVVKDKFYQDQKGSLVDEIIIDTLNQVIDYLKSKGDE